MSKILLVDDDRQLCKSLSDYLESEKYVVDLAHEAQDANHLLRLCEYDLVILDWMLPGASGMEVLKEIRSRGSKTPVIILTGRTTIDDKQEGFETGADDYLTKPFDPRELTLRVQALLRRSISQPANVLTAGPFSFHPRTLEMFRDEEVIRLMPKELALMEFFMRHPNEVFSLESLLTRVWPTDSDSSPDTVRVCISTLRSKIDTSKDVSYIVTVHGKGYKFVPQNS